jgi:hypothetical protein
MTGDPLAFWLAESHEMFEVLKLLGLKRLLLCAAPGGVLEALVPQATTTTAAIATMPIRLV